MRLASPNRDRGSLGASHRGLTRRSRARRAPPSESRFALYEMKVVLAEVASRVELRLAAGYRMQRVRRSITLAPSKGMPVVVERRAA